MAKFNLNPSQWDKLKGNVILVKKDELNRFAGYATELRDENNTLKEENSKLKETIEKQKDKIKSLKRDLNKKILNDEVGSDSTLSKLDKENKNLKDKLQKLESKYASMEKMYLEKIKELLNNNNTTLKDEIKRTIRDEFKNFENYEEGFEIIV